MTPLVGFSVVLGLVVALFFARHAAKRMRERRRRRQQLKRSVHRLPSKSSPRSEMRAYEDQRTVAGEITTRDGDHKRRS
jgi:hypothetical protein